ncbi:SHOCT domain-containing protein [Falsiroseomonas sp. E2-1-a4]|uniref:SHOCT domain-containing protein n=1 Tax=Falsiroseomonas sp. E2-1-a4 TaxID=3239299 RepID=UPI003F3C66B2
MMSKELFATAAAALLAPGAALAQVMGPGGGWGDRPWMIMHGGWGWGSGLAWLVALGVLVVVAVLVLRRRGARAAPCSAGGAVKALDLRYARGEIDHDEYLRRKADILGGG